MYDTALPCRPNTRSLSTTATNDAQAEGTASSTSDARSPPPATSQPAASQPFSTPLLPQKALAVALKKQVTAAQKEKVVSSVAAGTPLQGLNYFKNREDPVAMEDHEYPDWLWTVLQRRERDDTEGPPVDPRIYSKSEKSRRKANKRMRESAKRHEGMGEEKVPMYAQSVDLPAGEGSEEAVLAAQEARMELTKSLRQKRRSEIKESNFLKAMR
ncbi:MAG: hypothetical protein M1828_006179 [Chrysothrix sp. TS-e1954]|nr:MAG: hypothetical protein M1828_006179 [Chrysothrix sp. TS-e1954]